MYENISIEKQNEIMITWLLSHAGYYFRDKEKKKMAKEVKPPMNPLDCLRLVNERINGEATT